MQAAAGAGVQPGETPAEPVHPQLPAPQIFHVHIRYFQFPARGWFKAAGNCHHVIVVNVKPGHGVVAPGLPGFFLDGNCLPVPVEFHHAISLRVVDVITKNSRPALEFGKSPGKTIASVEYIIP